MERCHGKIAFHEMERQQKVVAGFKLDPHHFTIVESHIIESGMGYIGVGKVATFKSTFHKILVVQKALGEQTVQKMAIFVIALGQWILSIILFYEFFVFPKRCGHCSSVE
tara:strand:+ start:11225 stop:11554 length:330 start_codon:yes stop_codon:yes gene_type:complete